MTEYLQMRKDTSFTAQAVHILRQLRYAGSIPVVDTALAYYRLEQRREKEFWEAIKRNRFQLREIDMSAFYDDDDDDDDLT